MTEQKPSIPKPALWALICFLGVGLSSAAALWWQNRAIEPTVLNEAEQIELTEKLAEPPYQKGLQTITLTERQLNGLLHRHTQLGDQLTFELAQDAVHARLRAELDPDLPLLGGMTVKARARFLIGSDPARTSLALDDLTVYGISLPDAWLGHLKGRNLLADLNLQSSPALSSGIRSLQVLPGQLQLILAD